MINRLAIIGVGLIGGSLSLALKKASMVKEVIGYSQIQLVDQQAVDRGIIDKAATSVAEAVCNADIIFLAVPIGEMTPVLVELGKHVKDEAIITDGGSTKVRMVTEARAALGDKFSQFIPGHPIAGTEQSGHEYASASLYQGCRVILTPVKQTNNEALYTVRTMWQTIGAEVFAMAVEYHDVVLASTSHLPHVLVFTLVGMLAERDDCDEVLQYAASSFRDFSRIASSNAVMWRDICVTNKDAILELLYQYQQDLNKIEMAIRNEDSHYLIDVFERAKGARDTRFSKPT